MPISCDPNDLLEASKCFHCGIPTGMQLAVQTYLLDQIRISHGGAVMTVEQLLAAAKCFQHCIPAGFEGAVQLYLECQLANA